MSRPTVAFPLAELSANSNGMPVWVWCFGEDASLYTMEWADGCV